MRLIKSNIPIRLPFLMGLVFFSTILYLACDSSGSKPGGLTEDFLATTSPVIAVSPVIPKDIFSDGTTPASNATLSQAAVFAWNEFIALNWPAETGFRDSANAALAFGSQGGTVPLVWHTFRHKVEIYPGNDMPPPGYNPALADYGYNTSSPQYFYEPKKTNTSDGQVNPCSGTPSASTPWINLDENNEIGVATMFAGVGDANNFPGPQILFLAKANKAEYVYAAQRKWYAGENGLGTAKTNTEAYIQKNSNTPPPSSDSTLVSFPYGTIEIKTGWRLLTPAEKQSGRFYSTTVRYYNDKNGYPCYSDEEFGMVALHIIHKTPTAPYFIYATFEQADNLLTTGGDHVEDVNGNIIANQSLPPLDPNFKVTNATPTTPQTFSPTTANSSPGQSLYYQNDTTATNGLPKGIVTINKRLHPIPQEIIAANQAAHDSIANYNQRKGITNSPWSFYKLVNVQYKPINNPQAGVNYTGADSATYYLANSVVESDYILQKFSGKFSSLYSNFTDDFTITDFRDSGSTAVAYNAYYNDKFLMGGCMGCHGNATNGGTDYSFILGNPVGEPDVAGEPIDLNSSKNTRLRALLGF